MVDIPFQNEFLLTIIDPHKLMVWIFL